MCIRDSIYYSFGSLFLALRKAVYNVTLGITVQTVFIAVLLVGMYLRPSLWLLVAVNAVRAFALVLGAAWLTQRKLFALSMSWDSIAVRAALPFVGMAVVNALRDQIGVVMLGLLSNYDAVAYYNLVSRVQTASLAVPTAVAAVLTPLIVANGLDDGNRKRLVTATMLILGVALMRSAIVMAFPDRIAAILYG